METEPEIAVPCPFCGARRAILKQRHGYYVQCGACAAQGPRFTTENIAWLAWNRHLIGQVDRHDDFTVEQEVTMDTQELLQIQVKITDKAALERLTPEMVTAYLCRHEWDQQPYAFHRVTRWTKGDENLFVPADHTIGDYALRISEGLKQVAQTEHRSSLAVYVEMLEGNA